ncbi:hypothetical protein J6590_025585 [Homalodisca vitripennis]|nr:hypothetical protein J6590_025585 [Homalodisca vitripennis]
MIQEIGHRMRGRSTGLPRELRTMRSQTIDKLDNYDSGDWAPVEWEEDEDAKPPTPALSSRAPLHLINKWPASCIDSPFKMAVLRFVRDNKTIYEC